jgi:hypothetical protein
MTGNATAEGTFFADAKLARIAASWMRTGFTIKGALRLRRMPMKRNLSVFDKHQLKIAKDTLKMPDAMVAIMGGMTKEEAIELIKRFSPKKGRV